MSVLPPYINKKNYLKAKELYSESRICHKRAWILFISSAIFKKNDFHGAVEALQHAHELLLKSLYLLVGVEYKRSHDPGKEFVKFKERYFNVFPSLPKKKILKEFEQYVLTHSAEMSAIHETAIYGDEEKNIPASKLFSNEDFNYHVKKINAQYPILESMIIWIGKLLNLLTDKEEKKLLDDFERARRIKENPDLLKQIEKLLKKYFKNN